VLKSLVIIESNVSSCSHRNFDCEEKNLLKDVSSPSIQHEKKMQKD